MKYAVIAFTRRGYELGRGLSKGLGASLYCSGFGEDSEKFESLSVLTGRLFEECEGIIFISACGIAVRSVAPYIKSKQQDPAVIVIDDCGRFVIPILSGHLGGANRLAEDIAKALGAQAVITTATDGRGVPSPDMIAKDNGLIIDDFQAAKKIAAALVDGQRVGLDCDGFCDLKNLPPELGSSGSETGIYIGPYIRSPFGLTLRLIPKCVILGIGCKRGVGEEEIFSAADGVLKAAGIDIRAVKTVASVDLKADEAGLKAFCERLGAGFVTYSAEKLNEADGEFTGSAFVKQVTGVDCVCERSAVISGGELVIKKTAVGGVTVAAAISKFTVDLGG